MSGGGEILADNIIEPNHSLYSSPLFLVKMKRCLQLTVDFKALNHEVVLNNSHSLVVVFNLTLLICLSNEISSRPFNHLGFPLVITLCLLLESSDSKVSCFLKKKKKKKKKKKSKKVREVLSFSWF